MRILLPAMLAFAAPASIAGLNLAWAQPAQAQAAIDPAFLAEVQGRWVSRFPHSDIEFEVNGTEIRLVVAEEKVHGSGRSQYVPRAGDLVAVITGAERTGAKQGVDGKDYPEYVFYVRSISNHGDGWRISESSTTRHLTFNTQFCRDGSSGPTKPFSNYYTLSSPAVVTNDGWRAEAKSRIFPPRGSVPNWADPIVPGCKDGPSSRPNRTLGSASTATAAQPAQVSSDPVPPLSVPVTSEQEQREQAERERLNREQAEFGTRQLAENEANRQAYEQALRDREATIARQTAEHEAAVAAVEAERLRREREHEAAMARWRADVEACRKGDRSRCAQ